MKEEEKILQLISETGMTYEEAKNSWALKNWEESRMWANFFNNFINKVRETFQLSTTKFANAKELNN